MSKELIKRLIAGISGSALIMTFVSYHIYSFSLICLALIVLLLKEFYAITESYKPVGFLAQAFGVVSLGLVLAYQESYLVDFRLLLIPILLLFTIPLVVLFDKERTSVNSIAVTFMGILYIVLPVCLFLFMSKPSPEAEYNGQVILGIFLIIWSNDTGAYFSGKAFGKRKLFERISPNKTIEGSIGGVVLAFIIIAIFDYFFHSTQMSYVKWACLIIVVSIFGILGDLVESQIKRTLAIKDSGSVIPGHGGFLDRFDSLIFAIPFAFVCYLCFA